MIISLPKESTLISDTNAEEVMEQPIVVVNYSGGEGIGMISFDGDEIYIPYRMVKEVCKVMQAYAKQKPEST